MPLVPLPSWSNLLRAGVRRPPAGVQLEQMAKPWHTLGETAGWLSRSAWSLALIATWRQRVAKGSPLVAWIPDFFCNASLAPLRATGASLVFYPLDADMKPDFKACRSLATEQGPDLFVLVHYFGRPNTGEAAREFCATFGAWMIEDAAHVLSPTGGIGGWGDFVLYSPHKHLPIPDGAVLIARPSGPSKIPVDVMEDFGLPGNWSQQLRGSGTQDGTPARHALKDSCVWLGKRILQKFGIRNWRRVPPAFPDPIHGERAPSERLGPPQVSSLARRLLPGVVAQLDRVARARRRNQILWDSLIVRAAGSGGVETDERPQRDEWTPYLTSFRVDPAVAEETYENWVRRGLPVMTWPDLPPEVKADRERHTLAWSLRHARLYLPVHQTLRIPANDVDARKR
jgi:hypothetical protein